MTLTYGFYNSFEGDRTYDAVQLSSIFDGIITDGVLTSIGNAMMVTEGSGMSVTVGAGRAWFDHTWTDNDTEFLISLGLSEVVLNRIDAVVLETNSSDAVRANTIKVVHGTPSSVPDLPTLTRSITLNQYPLAYIYVHAGATSIVAANITNKVGTIDCPFLSSVVSDSILGVPGPDGNLLTSNGTAWVSETPVAVLPPAGSDGNLLTSNGSIWVSETPVAVLPPAGSDGNILTSNGTAWVSETPVIPQTIPSGAIMDYAGASAPSGWLLCDGAAISRTTYSALFSAIGTVFGVGNGTSTFNLPDARGRATIGAGTGSGLTARTLAANVGAETHALSTAELATHNHTDTGHTHTQASHNHSQAAHTHTFATWYVKVGAGAPDVGWINLPADGGSTWSTESKATAIGSTTPVISSGTATIGNAGSGTAHNTMQPSLVLNKIIKT